MRFPLCLQYSGILLKVRRLFFPSFCRSIFSLRLSALLLLSNLQVGTTEVTLFFLLFLLLLIDPFPPFLLNIFFFLLGIIPLLLPTYKLEGEQEKAGLVLAALLFSSFFQFLKSFSFLFSWDNPSPPLSNLQVGTTEGWAGVGSHTFFLFSLILFFLLGIIPLPPPANWRENNRGLGWCWQLHGPNCLLPQWDTYHTPPRITPKLAKAN